MAEHPAPVPTDSAADLPASAEVAPARPGPTTAPGYADVIQGEPMDRTCDGEAYVPLDPHDQLLPDAIDDTPN